MSPRTDREPCGGTCDRRTRPGVASPSRSLATAVPGSLARPVSRPAKGHPCPIRASAVPQRDEIGVDAAARATTGRNEEISPGLRSRRQALVEVMGFEPTTSSMRPKRCRSARNGFDLGFWRLDSPLRGSRARSVPERALTSASVTQPRRLMALVDRVAGTASQALSGPGSASQPSAIESIRA